MLYDLHLHSTMSDGDLTPQALVQEAHRRGVTGLSLTDHNGLWGTTAVVTEAKTLGLAYLEGIEVSVRDGETDWHILGYSRSFDRDVLAAGLEETRQGYERRIRRMVQLCQKAGYDQVTFEEIMACRFGQEAPSYISYDVGSLLTTKHGLSIAEARKLTVIGGACHVPYGDWALKPAVGIELIQQAGGVAVVAHPGTIAHEEGEERMWYLLEEAVASGVAGLEVRHPFHTEELTAALAAFVGKRELLTMAGSDWHGLDRYDDEAFGQFGVDEAGWQALLARLSPPR